MNESQYSKNIHEELERFVFEETSKIVPAQINVQGKEETYADKAFSYALSRYYSIINIDQVWLDKIQQNKLPDEDPKETLAQLLQAFKIKGREIQLSKLILDGVKIAIDRGLTPEQWGYNCFYTIIS